MIKMVLWRTRLDYLKYTEMASEYTFKHLNDLINFTARY